ncbi:MAG TPA: SRPBCC family protein [Dongiaceae bacterium]|jgi:uncharacterized protein YndB with AHSA1/START domain|nr:SRPBCC family protein [Dongiaceae bacterium]
MPERKPDRKSDRRVTHATFSIERTYDVPPAKVFAAFASIEAKARWFTGSNEWQQGRRSMDFRVGGKEHLSGGRKDQPVHHFDAIYQDIVPDERIIYSYEMHRDKERISVSLATIEFKRAGKGTRMLFTEQGAFLDDFDTPQIREEGTKELLDQLGRALK